MSLTDVVSRSGSLSQIDFKKFSSSIPLAPKLFPSIFTFVFLSHGCTFTKPRLGQYNTPRFLFTQLYIRHSFASIPIWVVLYTLPPLPPFWSCSGLIPAPFTIFLTALLRCQTVNNTHRLNASGGTESLLLLPVYQPKQVQDDLCVGYLATSLRAFCGNRFEARFTQFLWHIKQKSSSGILDNQILVLHQGKKITIFSTSDKLVIIFAQNSSPPLSVQIQLRKLFYTAKKCSTGQITAPPHNHYSLSGPDFEQYQEFANKIVCPATNISAICNMLKSKWCLNLLCKVC